VPHIIIDCCLTGGGLNSGGRGGRGKRLIARREEKDCGVRRDVD